MSVLYELKNISKIYNEGKVCALSNINLKIYQSEILVILGPSGSGKSTLLNILGGIDKESSGNLLFQNKSIAHLKAYHHLIIIIIIFYNSIIREREYLKSRRFY